MTLGYLLSFVVFALVCAAILAHGLGDDLRICWRQLVDRVRRWRRR